MEAKDRKKPGRKPGEPRVYINTKIKPEVKKKLNIISASTGDPANLILEELIEREYKIKKDNGELLI